MMLRGMQLWQMWGADASAHEGLLGRMERRQMPSSKQWEARRPKRSLGSGNAWVWCLSLCWDADPVLSKLQCKLCKQQLSLSQTPNAL